MKSAELLAFPFKAVIDRVRIEVTFQNPTQVKYLQARTAQAKGKTYFYPQDTAGREWEFWMQDPIGPTQVMRDVQALRGPNEPAIAEHQVRITGLEMAIDAYHPSSDPDALAEAALHFFRHRANLAKGSPRIPMPRYLDNPRLAAEWKAIQAAHAQATAEAYRLGLEPPLALPKRYGSCPAVESPAHALQVLKYGLGIHQGAAPNKKTGKCKDDVGQHVYVKSTDTVKGGEAHAPLPLKEHRARMETRLQSDNQNSKPLPFSTIAAWRTFRFAALSEEFALVVLIQSATPLQVAMAARQTQLARNPELPSKGRPDNRLKSQITTRRDSVINDKIRMALRALDSPAMLRKR